MGEGLLLKMGASCDAFAHGVICIWQRIENCVCWRAYLRVVSMYNMWAMSNVSVYPQVQVPGNYKESK